MSGGSSILDGLNEAQFYAVTLGPGPILVIAGAGTGKTRTLVHRVAWLVEQGVAPSSILLVTFTRRAAQEMLSRARELHPTCQAVQGGTFHSVCNRLLRRHGRGVGLEPNFTILDPADCAQIVKGLTQELGLKEKGDKHFPKAGAVVDMISRSRNLEMDLAQAAQERGGAVEEYLEQLGQLAGAYAKAKREQQLVDYDDLLYLTEELLNQDRDLREQLNRRWEHLLVDEYQDTNAVQARLVRLLAGERGNVMVVGDDAQSIYAFRGARHENILQFPQRFKDTRLVKLEQNYRSTQPILDLSNQVIAQAREGYRKELFTEVLGRARPRLMRPRDQRGQSQLVVEEIQSLLGEGVSPTQIAVLFRSGRDSFDLENELRAAHLPYVKYGGIRFHELAHVKDVLAHLRVLANPRDYLAWQRVLLLLPKVGPKGAQALMAHLLQETARPGDYAQALTSAPQASRLPQLLELAELFRELAWPGRQPAEQVELVMDYYAPLCREQYQDYPRRLRDLGELPGLASQSESLDAFLADTSLDPPEAEGLGGGEFLTLSTVHSAKGKEWQQVFILWANEGRLPAFPAFDDPRALEEELRLFYVACTRAGQGLTLMAPREHYYENKGWQPVPLTRFVAELPPNLLEESGPAQVFEVPTPPPVSRGSNRQDRPFAVMSKVRHPTFGPGKVMGYKGGDKIFIRFDKGGLKTLLLAKAKLEPMS